MKMDIEYFCIIIILCLETVFGEEENVIEGDRATLPCKSQLQGEYGRVMWQDASGDVLSMNTDIITDDSRLSVDNSYADEWNLIIDDVHTGDAGTYKCVIDSDPLQEFSVTLNVWYPPSYINKSEDVSVQTGSDVTLSCTADGEPAPRITWYFILPSNERQLLAENSEVYTVFHADQQHAGVYECEADNDVPHPKSAFIKVDVRFTPVLVLPHPQISQSEGKDTILDCIVTANPLSRHVWIKDGEEIHNSERFTLRSWDVGIYTKRLDVFITGIVNDDYGAYTCVAENQYGHTNATMHLYHELHTGTVRVLESPDDAIVHASHDARFNCTVEGMGSRDNLIWWHHHLATNTFTKLFESNPSSLVKPKSNHLSKVNLETDKIEVIGLFDIIVKDVTMQDSGIYICELVGLQNYSADLTVVDNLVCGANLTDVIQGERMNLSCSMKYSGAQSTWDVTWSHETIKLSSIDYDKPGMLQRMVSFRTWESDSGRYTCSVRGPSNMIPQSCSAYLTVTEPDEVTAAPIDGEPPVYTSQLSMVGVVLGAALVVMALLFIIILAATVKYYRTEINKLKPRRPVVSAHYKNGSVSVEQQRPLTERTDSNPEPEEV